MGTFALCISAIPLLLLFYWNEQVFSRTFSAFGLLFAHSSPAIESQIYCWMHFVSEYEAIFIKAKCTKQAKKGIKSSDMCCIILMSNMNRTLKTLPPNMALIVLNWICDRCLWGRLNLEPRAAAWNVPSAWLSCNFIVHRGWLSFCVIDFFPQVTRCRKIFMLMKFLNRFTLRKTSIRFSWGRGKVFVLAKRATLRNDNFQW